MPPFRRPKPKILVDTRSRGMESHDPLVGLPWASDFSLSSPRDLHSAQKIIEMSKIKGQQWMVHHASEVRPNPGNAAAIFESYPTSAEIQEAVGGGSPLTGTSS